MGDETGLARVGHSQLTREQEENAFITAAQTGADSEAGTQQLRLIRFANPRSGQQVIDAAGAPAVIEALAETVFLTCGTAAFLRRGCISPVRGTPPGWGGCRVKRRAPI